MPWSLLHCGDDSCFQKAEQRRNLQKRPIEPPLTCGLCVVLNTLSEQVRECLLHAENCARQAATEINPELKASFLGLERSWLLLARGYEFTDQADRLLR